MQSFAKQVNVLWNRVSRASIVAALRGVEAPTTRNYAVKRGPLKLPLKEFKIGPTGHLKNMKMEDDKSELSDYLEEKFENNPELTVEQWDNLKSDLFGFPLGNGKSVNRVNVDSVILKEIVRIENVGLGKSFYESQNHKTSVILTDYVLKLFIKTDYIQVEQFEDFVIDFASKVLKDDEASGPTQNIHWQALESLARTRVWREMVEKYVTEEKFPDSRSSVAAVTAFVLRALQEKDYDLVWQLVQGKLFNMEFDVLRGNIREELASCYEKFNCNWINHCEVVREEKGEEVAELAMEKLFIYLRTVGRYAGKETKAALLEYYKQSKSRTARLSSVNKGACKTCKTEMEMRVISQQEMDMVKEALLTFVIKKKDIYQNTDPKELHRFLELLEKEKGIRPFDIVIDGLNVSLAPVPKHLRSWKNQSRNLHDTVKFFHDRDHRVLVIHRNDIKKTPHYDIINSMSTVVTLGKVTQDDPYMILAALHSGSGCKVVTNDHLRQHYACIAQGSVDLAKLFSEWQLAHQIRISGFAGYSGAVNKNQVTSADPVFIWPITHCLAAEQARPFWHIPIMPTDTRHGFNVPTTWLCVGPSTLNEE